MCLVRLQDFGFFVIAIVELLSQKYGGYANSQFNQMA
jgi:hypothetical protein